MSETQLVSAILAALELEPGVVAWRNNSGKRGRVSFGLGKGSADIIACVGPYGRFLGLEAKVADGVLSNDQGAWRDNVCRNGGCYCVVRSVEAARRAVEWTRRSQEGPAAHNVYQMQAKSYSVGRRR